MISALTDVLEGRKPPSPMPKEINEFYLALEFGWTLDYIRNSDYRDMDLMAHMVKIKKSLDSKEKRSKSKKQVYSDF